MVLEKVARSIYNNPYQKSEVPLESEIRYFPLDKELSIMRRTASNLAIPKTLQDMVRDRIVRFCLDTHKKCMSEILERVPNSFGCGPDPWGQIDPGVGFDPCEEFDPWEQLEPWEQRMYKLAE
ncbi:hypothetical protein NPIL_90231 [Nephila pilipes]|uniref:Uncharacterized protein n=1 Tax=Nephila pilipes TaxID=299642 RepID=A0A8X6QH73_NEPPI|nr:hypothetical protein NPIL_90231 [Nephila pilipes]